MKKGVIVRKILIITAFLFNPVSEKAMYVLSSGKKPKTFFKNRRISISGTVLGNRLTGEIIVIHHNKE